MEQSCVQRDSAKSEEWSCCSSATVFYQAIVHEDITTPGHTPIHHPLLTFGEGGHELRTSHTPLHREKSTLQGKQPHAPKEAAGS